jgi:hypothetical protein
VSTGKVIDVYKDRGALKTTVTTILHGVTSQKALIFQKVNSFRPTVTHSLKVNKPGERIKCCRYTAGVTVFAIHSYL